MGRKRERGKIYSEMEIRGERSQEKEEALYGWCVKMVVKRGCEGKNFNFAVKAPVTQA